MQMVVRIYQEEGVGPHLLEGEEEPDYSEVEGQENSAAVLNLVVEGEGLPSIQSRSLEHEMT